MTTKLYIIDSENYFKNLVLIIKKEIATKKVIYLTTNKPYNHLVKIFEKNGIKYDNFFFVDCISKHIGIKEEPEKCIFVESPESLTEMSIDINESIKQIPGKKTLFIDSLSALLIYNNMETVGKFSNSLINKMRAYDVDTVILALESDVNKDIIKQIESFVDEVKKYD